jgi:hypothetical protein
MAVTTDRLHEGMSFDDYVGQMTKNKERFLENYASVKIDPQALTQVRALPRPIDVLVIAEDWCGDVINNLPTLGRLAADSEKLNLHVFLRDKNLDLMNQYLNQGKFMSIPVFVFFDESMGEIGRFIERSPEVTRFNLESRQRVLDENPDLNKPVDELTEEERTRLQAKISAARLTFLPKAQSLVIEEICTILAKHAA